MNAKLLIVSVLGPRRLESVRVIRRGPKRATIEALKRTALPGRWIEKGARANVPSAALG